MQLLNTNKTQPLKRLIKNIEPFTISCSQIGKIMGSAKKKDELSQGAKSYCELWLLSRLYEKKKIFTSKYTTKGIECEADAIVYLEEVLEWGLALKNDIRLQNDFFQGECDVRLFDRIVDVKNSFDFTTFPIFEDKIPNSDYYYQGQGYMDLYGVKKYELIYVLMDAPEEVIRKEAYFKLGREYSEIQYLEFAEQYFYSHFPKELRVKKFEFEYDIDTIEAIRNRVIECRKYIETLKVKILNNK